MYNLQKCFIINNNNNKEKSKKKTIFSQPGERLWLQTQIQIMRFNKQSVGQNLEGKKWPAYIRY